MKRRKTSQTIGFGIDTTKDNDTKEGKKPAFDIQYNEKEQSVNTIVNIASIKVPKINIQSPTLSVETLEDSEGIEVSKIQADVKVNFEKEESEGEKARPLSIDINRFNVGEINAKGIKIVMKEAVETSEESKKKKTQKIQEVLLPKEDKISIKNIKLNGLKVTMDDAGPKLNPTDKDASLEVGETSLGGIRYREKSAKGTVLKAFALHKGNFDALSLEAIGRNDRPYSLKEFFKFFGRTRVKGLDTVGSYTDGKTSGTIGIKGKKNQAISVDYHEGKDGKKDFYTIRLPLSRINIPALKLEQDGSTVTIPKAPNPSKMSHLSDIDVKLKAYLEQDEQGEFKYDIYLQSLDVKKANIYGLQYKDDEGTEVKFDPKKPLQIHNLKAGGFRFSSTKAFDVFGKDGGWLKASADGTDLNQAHFEQIKSKITNGSFLAESEGTRSAVSIDIKSFGFNLDKEGNMKFTLEGISGGFPKMTITQKDPVTEVTTSTIIESDDKNALAADKLVLDLYKDEEDKTKLKEVNVFGIKAGGIDVTSTDTKDKKKLKETHLRIEKEGLGTDHVKAEIAKDNSKKITITEINGGKIKLTLNSWDKSQKSVVEIGLPKPDAVHIPSVTVETFIDTDKKEKIKSLSVQKPTIKGFELSLPDQKHIDDGLKVFCDLGIEGDVNLVEGNFKNMSITTPHDAYLLLISDNTPIQIKNFRLEYKNTAKSSSKASGSSTTPKSEYEKSLPAKQKYLLKLEKIKNDAEEHYKSTQPAYPGPNGSIIENPAWEDALKNFRSAESDYNSYKKQMIADAKKEAGKSITKEVFDAVEGDVKADLEIYDTKLPLEIETFNHQLYLNFSNKVTQRLKSLIRDIVFHTYDQDFWSSDDMKKLGKGLQRWYTWGAPYTRGLIDAIAEGNGLGAILVFLDRTEITPGTLKEDSNLFGLNFNINTSWALDATQYDTFGVGLTEIKGNKHPYKMDYYKLYGFVEYLNYISPALKTVAGEQDAARLKRMVEKFGLGLSQDELDDMGIGDVVKELIAFVNYSIKQEIKSIQSNITNSIKGINVDADLTLKPEELINRLLKDKKAGNISLDKGKKSLDDIHIEGGFNKGNNPEISGSAGAGSKGKENIIIPGLTYFAQDNKTKVSYDSLSITPVNLTGHNGEIKVSSDTLLLNGLKVAIKKK